MSHEEDIDADFIRDMFLTLNRMGFGEAQWISSKSNNNIFEDLYPGRDWWEGYRIRMLVTEQKYYSERRR